jgi:hypothetical protein
VFFSFPFKVNFCESNSLRWIFPGLNRITKCHFVTVFFLDGIKTLKNSRNVVLSGFPEWLKISRESKEERCTTTATTSGRLGRPSDSLLFSNEWLCVWGIVFFRCSSSRERKGWRVWIVCVFVCAHPSPVASFTMNSLSVLLLWQQLWAHLSLFLLNSFPFIPLFLSLCLFPLIQLLNDCRRPPPLSV